jgi:hypothetical protein
MKPATTRPKPAAQCEPKSRSDAKITMRSRNHLRLKQHYDAIEAGVAALDDPALKERTAASGVKPATPGVRSSVLAGHGRR